MPGLRKNIKSSIRSFFKRPVVQFFAFSLLGSAIYSIRFVSFPVECAEPPLRAAGLLQISSPGGKGGGPVIFLDFFLPTCHYADLGEEHRCYAYEEVRPWAGKPVVMEYWTCQSGLSTVKLLGEIRADGRPLPRFSRAELEASRARAADQPYWVYGIFPAIFTGLMFIFYFLLPNPARRPEEETQP
ncbi:Uncharacterised protein [Bordetella ansorpii]|uniref:Transmembrane protein n=1 Tax=Bordetella ansorpii TaxID=288768 RepID=A0A157PDI2_9BORD|nr:hypothetical protein [Bordetella ansorpii]SAI31376.1 Uncharacterised protein [Bordetella ansorpii]